VQLYSGEETKGAAELGGQTGRAASSVREPSAVRGEYGKSLLRRRGDLVERSFAHCYETGAMRRCICADRKHSEAAVVHVGAFNLRLILRKLLGAGTPREWKNRFRQACFDPFLTLPVSDKSGSGFAEANLCVRCQSAS